MHYLIFIIYKYLHTNAYSNAFDQPFFRNIRLMLFFQNECQQGHLIGNKIKYEMKN